jgi:hypothetical protein
MRKAMGIWQAIMMILLVSGMMIVVLKYASISSKHVANTFVREQSELYLNSVIEQTLLAISLHDKATNGCQTTPFTQSITQRGITYSARVDIVKYYLQEGSSDLTNCSIGVSIKPSSELSHGMALFEVEVSAAKQDGTIVSRILRRSLQQP